MSTFSIDGLVSGLNTTDIISNLMRLERRPQALLQNRQREVQSSKTALEGLKTKLDALEGAANAIRDAGGWAALKATSSDPDSVEVTSSGSGAPSSMAIQVDQLAQASTVASGSGTLTLGTVIAGGTVDVAKGAAPATTVNVGGGTLQEVVDGINGTAGLGVVASAVQVAPGQYRLQLTSTTTGADSTLSVTGLNGTAGGVTTVMAAQDAVVRVGTGPGAYTVASTTNAFNGVVPGLSFTVKAVTTGTISIAGSRDSEAVQKKVEELVAKANDVLADIKKQTKYDAATKKGSPLTGESSVRRLQDQVLRAVSDALTSPGGFTTPSQVGIQTTREGTITFDAAKFSSAYAADPAKVQATFTSTDPANPGLAQRLHAVGDLATNSTGYITSTIRGHDDTYVDMQKQIDRWEIRLEQRERALKRQFSALETALGGLRTQGNWLTQQLNGLAASSGR